MSSKSIQCRAGVVWKPNDPVSIETVEVAAPDDNEVRVKMTNVGICQSDLTYHKGSSKLAKFPTILGHEGSGIIESIGKNVKSVKPGDHVLVLWNIHCGQCRGCKHPTSTVCDTMPYYFLNYSSDGKEYSRIKAKGERISQCFGVGAFSEYTVLHEISVLKIDPSVPLEKAALFGCCVPTGFGAAKYDAKVTPGSIVAVWGLGAVGLCTVLGSRSCNAKQIIGIDINSKKFELGKKFGCTDFINPLELKKPIDEEIKKMTGGGVDYAFVCIGLESVVEDAFECCHPMTGECVILGITEDGRNINISPLPFIYGKKLIGSCCGGTTTKDMTELIDMHMKGEISVDDFITGRIKLDQINEGFDMLKQGKSIRTIVDM